MRVREGPRPWPIVVFCGATLASGLFDLLAMLSGIEELSDDLALVFPQVDATRDLAIVVASAIFTIVLIPIVAIWFFASRVARILVTVAALVLLIPLVLPAFTLGFDTRTDIASFVLALLSLGSVALLWSPPARDWFERERRVEPSVFE